MNPPDIDKTYNTWEQQIQYHTVLTYNQFESAIFIMLPGTFLSAVLLFSIT